MSIPCAAPYMYSGEFTARPFAATYQFASSMLSRSAPVQPASPLPSIAEIQQAFYEARQQAPPHTETDFSYHTVTAMREKMIQDASTVGEANSISSEEHDDSDEEGFPGTAPAQTTSHEDEEAHVEGSSLGHAGSGATWQQEESSGLEAALHNSWGRALSAARAVVRPISIFWQGSREQPHRQPHAHDDQADANDDLSSHGDTSAYPFAATDSLSRAWRDMCQQAAGMAGKLVSTVQSAADSALTHTPERALNSLRAAAQGPATVIRHRWDVLRHRLSEAKWPGSMSSRGGTTSEVSSLGGGTDSSLPATQLSSASDVMVSIISDPHPNQSM